MRHSATTPTRAGTTIPRRRRLKPASQSQSRLLGSTSMRGARVVISAWPRTSNNLPHTAAHCDVINVAYIWMRPAASTHAHAHACMHGACNSPPSQHAACHCPRLDAGYNAAPPAFDATVARPLIQRRRCSFPCRTPHRCRHTWSSSVPPDELELVVLHHAHVAASRDVLLHRAQQHGALLPLRLAERHVRKAEDGPR